MPGHGYRIRPARPEDGDAVVEMWREMADQHTEYDAERWSWAADATERWRDHFLDMIGKADWIALVAADGQDRAVGFATAHLRAVAPVFAAGRAGDIGNMAVAAAYRRRGIGRLLTSAVLAELKARGAQYVALGVACANQPAIGLYKRFGFRDVMRSMFLKL